MKSKAAVKRRRIVTKELIKKIAKRNEKFIKKFEIENPKKKFVKAENNLEKPKNENEWTEELALELGNKLLDFLRSDKKNYSVKSFFLVENSHSWTLIKRLKDKYPSFADLYNDAKEIQEEKMIDLAVNRQIDPPFTKFLLKAWEGGSYRAADASSVDLTTKGDKLNAGASVEIYNATATVVKLPENNRDDQVILDAG